MHSHGRPTDLQIVANPAAFCHVPAAFALSWAALKSQRGQIVHLDRLGEPAYRIEPAPQDRDPGEHSVAAVMAACRGRAYASAAARGLPVMPHLPPSLRPAPVWGCGYLAPDDGDGAA